MTAGSRPPTSSRVRAVRKYMWKSTIVTVKEKLEMSDIEPTQSRTHFCIYQQGKKDTTAYVQMSLFGHYHDEGNSYHRGREDHRVLVEG